MFRYWWSPNRKFWYYFYGTIICVPLVLIIGTIVSVFSPTAIDNKGRINEVEQRCVEWNPEYSFYDVSNLYSIDNKFERYNEYKGCVVTVTGSVRVMGRDSYFHSMNETHLNSMQGSIYVDSIQTDDLYIVCEFDDITMGELLEKYAENDMVTVIGEVGWNGYNVKLTNCEIKHN